MNVVGCDCNTTDLDVCPNCGTHSGRKFEPHRIQEKTKDFQILPEILDFQYSDDMKMRISMLYHQVTKGKVKRNAPRRAIIFWCIISVCKENKTIFAPAELKMKLDLKDQDTNKVSKEISGTLGNVQISIEDYLRSIMQSIDMNQDCLDEMLRLYSVCKKASPKFNASKVETLAYGVVFYYLNKTYPNFDFDKKFYPISAVSKDAVQTISTEMDRVISG